MLDIIIGSLVELFDPAHLLHLLVGVVLGLVVGVLPGLGGIVGLSLLLPFLYGMDQVSALAMLIGLLAVIPTSDTFTSILMGIPGSTASQATVLDGFPLARKGQAARALSAAFSASLFGGIFGALVLTVFVIVARPVILLFGTPELFALTLFGLSLVGTLSGANMWKGVAAAALGLVFGMIGSAPATGEYRMDFGNLYLGSGLPLVIVALGMFALPEIVDLLRSRSAIAAEPNRLGTGWMQGLRDTVAARWLVLRCSGIGALIGTIPGIGGSVVDWIAYGHGIQTAKDRSEFGKGDIRGVIAPESANNACAGGSLIPTLLFGIPGSGSMAVFLAALVLLGVQPGPSMADPARHLDLTYVIVWSLALASVIGTALCILVAPGISRLTTIRYPLIAPFMIMFVCFAAFQATRSLTDLVVLVALGLVGVMLRRFGWSRPAFLIGFALATQSERYLYQAVQFSGSGFMFRPLVLIIVAVTVLSVWQGTRHRPSEIGGSFAPGEGAARQHPVMLRAQILFAAAVLCVFAYALWEALHLSFLGGVFPTVIAGIGIVTTGMVLWPLIRGDQGSSANVDSEATEENAGKAGLWGPLAWLAGLVGLVGLVGFFAALVIFFPVFLRRVAGAGWGQTVLLTACAAATILTMAWSLNLVLPAGLLQAQVSLPWPLR